VTDVTLTLTSDESLVLFEMLHRWEDAGKIDTALMPGEQVALWAISAALERVLVEPFDVRYDEIVAEARNRLLDGGGA
jgi:hypothetical protein